MLRMIKIIMIYKLLKKNIDDVDNTDAITLAAYSIAKKSDAKAIITFSVSGRTTTRMARERAPVQIVVYLQILYYKKNAIILGV